MEEEILLEKRYQIPYETFGNAFRAFQKKFVYPRNNIMALILIVFAAVNVVNISMGNGTTLGYVLVCVCLALAAVNWYNPRKLRRNLMESIKGIEGDVYSLKIYPDKLKIGTVLEPVEDEKKEAFEEAFEGIGEPQEQIAESEIFLTKDVKIVEKEEFFLVYIKRAMFYVVPKENFTEEEITVMQLHFQKQLEKNFISDIRRK
ncbi:MAG: YcxB family protein [Porcipelethomonas sp.]